MDENINLNNEDNQNQDNSRDDIRFDVENTVEVVSADSAKKKNKLPVIIAAAVLLVAIVCGIVWFVAGGNDNSDESVGEETSAEETSDSFSELFWHIESNIEEDLTDEEGQSISREEYISKVQAIVSEATTSVSENVGSYNPNTIVENTTAAITQGVQAQDTQQVEKAENAIKAFFNRSCYIKGAMYGGGEGNSLVMSMDGSNFEILTNLEGTEVAILSLDDVLYIKRPATKQYLEMTETVMDLIGINASDFSMDFGSANYETMQEKLVGTYDITINGEDGVCHEYKNEDQIYKFYTVDGSLKEIDICNSEGTADTQLVIDYFSESIPGDQLTLKGYTASSVTVIFADLM